jgi:hypothetical protein
LFYCRITVEEIGCQTILTHSKHQEILNQLIPALDVNDPSRATNAAFAIGRLIEGDNGKKTLVSDCGQSKLVINNFFLFRISFVCLFRIV